MTKVLFTGSFDPITKGHMDIIEQASNLFDEVLIGILINPEKKNAFFSQKERLEIIREIYKKKKNINVISSTKLGVDLAKEKDCKIIIRGLRSILDFEYEYQLSLTNTDLSNNEVTTVCLFSKPEYQNISSPESDDNETIDSDTSLNDNELEQPPETLDDTITYVYLLIASMIIIFGVLIYKRKKK